MIVIKEPNNIKKLYSLDFGTYFILASEDEPNSVFMSMCVRNYSKGSSYEYEYKVLELEGCGGGEHWMPEETEVIPVDIIKMYVKED